ncbi:integrase, catalytic region, zinc finger, CCHC-type containing protein [Tanacetum coccineum]
MRKCILEGPYEPSTVVFEAIAATKNSPEVPQREEVETILNMSAENKAHFQAEKEAIFLLLTGIGDKIYSTVDACKTANEMYFDLLKQYQKEVNEIRAERIAKSANPLALVATAQPYQDNYFPAQKHQRHKGKEIAKPVTPPSEQAQKDKEMQKNLALIAKYFKKLYKPTNNNLRTSSNTRNKTEDTSPRYKNDNRSGQFRNQRTMTVVGDSKTVGSHVMQKNGIQCFNCKKYGHFAKECRNPKRVKDYSYHKEKMLMCKQAEKGVPLQAEQADWLEDTD